jgi:hypothetical protein
MKYGMKKYIIFTSLEIKLFNNKGFYFIVEVKIFSLYISLKNMFTVNELYLQRILGIIDEMKGKESLREKVPPVHPITRWMRRVRCCRRLLV